MSVVCQCIANLQEQNTLRTEVLTVHFQEFQQYEVITPTQPNQAFRNTGLAAGPQDKNYNALVPLSLQQLVITRLQTEF